MNIRSIRFAVERTDILLASKIIHAKGSLTNLHIGPLPDKFLKAKIIVTS